MVESIAEHLCCWGRMQPDLSAECAAREVTQRATGGALEAWSSETTGITRGRELKCGIL